MTLVLGILIGAVTVAFLGWLVRDMARHRDESVERIARLEASRADSTERVASVLAESFTSMFATLYGPRERANESPNPEIATLMGGFAPQLPEIVEEWQDWTDADYPTPPERDAAAIVPPGESWRDIAGLED